MFLYVDIFHIPADTLKLFFCFDDAVRALDFVNVCVIAFSGDDIDFSKQSLFETDRNVQRNRVVVVLYALTEFNNITVVFS